MVVNKLVSQTDLTVGCGHALPVVAVMAELAGHVSTFATFAISKFVQLAATLS